MSDKQYREARIIYDALTQAGVKHDPNIIEKLRNLLNLGSNPNALENRINRLLKGLPVEDEFEATMLWLGNCKLIHKLDQEQYPAVSKEEYGIPDFLVVFDHNGSRIPCLVEVKASPDEILGRGRIKFGQRLYKSLSNYARIANLPLLIAWKIGAYWVLFDHGQMKKLNSAYSMNSVDELKKDLMFVLAGNQVFTPMPGAKIIISLETKTEIREKEKESQTIGKFTGLRIEDSSGNKIESLTWPDLLLLILTCLDEKQNNIGKQHEIIFQIPSTAPSLQAYMILPFILFEIDSPKGKLNNWHEAILTDRINDLSYKEICNSAERGIGKNMRYILRVIPDEFPEFIPDNSPHRGHIEEILRTGSITR